MAVTVIVRSPVKRGCAFILILLILLLLRIRFLWSAHVMNAGADGDGDIVTSCCRSVAVVEEGEVTVSIVVHFVIIGLSAHTSVGGFVSCVLPASLDLTLNEVIVVLCGCITKKSKAGKSIDIGLMGRAEGGERCGRWADLIESFRKNSWFAKEEKESKGPTFILSTVNKQ